MKRVITYGTFDLFHIGHWNLLKRAKKEGNYLVVAVSTDEFNLNKGKLSQMNFSQRKEVIESLNFVDEIIEESSWEQKINDIKNYNIDIFIMGSDWEGKFDFLKDYCQVKYLERTNGISSTVLKDILEKL